MAIEKTVGQTVNEISSMMTRNLMIGMKATPVAVYFRGVDKDKKLTEFLKSMGPLGEEFRKSLEDLASYMEADLKKMTGR